MTEKRLLEAMDAMHRDHARRVRSIGKVAAAAALVASGRLLLMDLTLPERVKVERLVEDLLP